MLLPTLLDAPALRRGVARARGLGRDVVGAWLGPDVNPAPLEQVGFERGWSPWWMAAQLVDVPAEADQRVRLQLETDDYQGEHAAYGRLLALAREQPTRAWYAGAHVDGRFAGHAWSFVDGELAGVFDMEVWPPFRLRGLGTALLAAVCAGARRAGARHAVLNATPDGELLYRTAGFRRIGDGVTWWRHLAD
ncbi:GNAT family N-acetyltransferase [Nakamurella endophytica]|uniref:N-acetyltransferase domain-containing protein n=1 Tax=Nakamurella endophytica TaxID=1748367 RepID=A0A917WJ52_9ACTN|nr:GNAT family N-acetyltransferase [Nakamurella endophytica]GGM08113.1 hypothetical protein GCM10011594_30100 [Nakamurella endophytica]